MSVDHGLNEKRIINGTTYNTATSELVVWESDPHTKKDLELLEDLKERLLNDDDPESTPDNYDAVSIGVGIFKSRQGDFFEVFWEYSKAVGGKNTSITPKSPHEVHYLLEGMGRYDLISKFFGKGESKESRLTVRMSKILQTRLSDLADRHSLSLNAFIVRSLEDVVDYQTGEDWTNNYRLFEQFVKREGHAQVPKNHKESGHNLFEWVKEQKNALLSAAQSEKLSALGLTWEEQKDDDWERNFKVLKTYSEQTSNKNPLSKLAQTHRVSNSTLKKRLVKYKDQKFYHWVQQQRFQKQNLTDDQIRRLDEIGFVWKPNDETWEKGFRMLSVFYEEYGHSDVPRGYMAGAFRLGSWVSRQRHQKWHNALSDERTNRLNELEFIWDTSMKRWMEGFEALKSFKKREGHTLVPQQYHENNFELGKWVHKQRKYRDSLTLDKREMLDSVDTSYPNKKDGDDDVI